VEGPWVHGGWARGDGSHLGDVQFNAKTGEYFRANIQFPFFEHYLKGKGAAQPKAVVFETGTNVWRTLTRGRPRPPRRRRSTSMRRQAELRSADRGRGVDEYVSDPNHPVPFVGYTTDTVPQRYMVDDQRFASYRPDVLVYQTEPLKRM
jgi:predicted acyl esterase